MRISAPATAPELPNCSLTNLPKRLELALRLVFALPKASVIGLDLRTASEIAASRPPVPVRASLSGSPAARLVSRAYVLLDWGAPAPGASGYSPMCLTHRGCSSVCVEGRSPLVLEGLA